jgi:hypothetical protein
MHTKIVTTIGPGGWDRYGRRFVESFKKFWPASVELEIWHHDLGGSIPSYPGIIFKALDHTDSFKKLKAALGAEAKDGPSLQFCFKAIALAQAVTPELDWIGFIDADTETMQPVDASLLEQLFDNDYHLTYLYRRSVKESEGSWFAFNLRTVPGASLLADYWGLYDSLEAFHYRKSHDNSILDRLVLLHRAHGLLVKNLAEGALGLDAFHQSPLGAYMVHYKGPNKDTVADPGLAVPSRYGLLTEILAHAIKHTERADIVEVGTWNGSRAVQLAEAAFATGQMEVSYVGFDTFDAGNDRAHEGHTKPHASYAHVSRRLANYAKVCGRLGRQFSYTLVPGNTLETLTADRPEIHRATFAYIDGGHSYETVASDYAALKAVPYVVLDDVIPQEEAGAPDGPRKLFAEIAEPKQLFNTGDGYFGLEQAIHFGMVTRKGYLPFQLQTKLTVKPVDSVDKAEQFKHIADNTAAMPTWLVQYQAHERTALLVSAGPTLEQFLPDIRVKQALGATVFAVKHALPQLKAAGIVPDFVVVLDPREIGGRSTHGVVRSTLFDSAAEGDKFLFATMTHPSVRQYLEAKGCQLIGWHAHTQGVVEAKLPALNQGLTIGGGTCSATRMPMLAFIMGFRRMEFYGYDFFYPENTDQKIIKQELIRVGIGADGKHQFLTTGELVAAMQDLGVWTRWMVENKLTVVFHGEGAGAVIWDQTAPGYEALPEWPWK